jgi:hypothetical protein
MVPKPEELERDIYEDDEEIGYTWVREYHWDMRKETEKSYVFCFGGDTVTYVVGTLCTLLTIVFWLNFWS